MATAIRTYQLVHVQSAVPEVAGAIGDALRAGDLPRARALYRDAEGAAFSTVAEALLDALDASAPRRNAEFEGELRRAVSSALTGVRERLESGRVRDLLVSLVLLGAVFYAARSGMAPSMFFYVLASLGAVLAASGYALRPRLADRVERAAERLVQAALEGADRDRGMGEEPCPQCGATEAIVASEAALGAAAELLGLNELRVCRSCGYTQGFAGNPGRIPVGPEHGTSLSAGGIPAEDEAEADSPEHGG